MNLFVPNEAKKNILIALKEGTALLEGARVHLFKEAVLDGRDTTLSALEDVEADFEGYEAQVLEEFTAEIINDDHYASTSPNSVGFQCTVGETGAIYGLYITNDDDTQLIMVGGSNSAPFAWAAPLVFAFQIDVLSGSIFDN